MLPRGVAALLFLALSVPFVEAQFTLGRPCFCKGPEGEAVDDCPCDGEASIDDLNNRRVFPILQRLLQKDFFRFYKVNMEKTCPFWADERQCGTTMCGIKNCDNEVPAALRRPTVVSVVRLNRESHMEILTLNRTIENNIRRVQVRPSSTPSSAEAKDVDDKPGCEEAISNQFDPLDASLSDENQAQLQQMDEEDNMNKFCDYDDEDSEDSHYVDLTKNPERYTGYTGNSAWKVWKSIYQENCFKPDPKFDKDFLMHPNTVGLCLEKRVFYRLMSGMHSAISISISSHNYKPAPVGFGSGTWFRNNKMFEKAFGTSVSAEGPERLKNVYFVYLLELRALMKAAPYLQQELFFTGNEEEDRETRKLVENLMEVVKSYRHQFDETEMFTGVESHARELREEFRQHFVNISRIMDCVECDKCRLWGKLQTHGMGTALKILFSDLPSSLFKSSEGNFIPSNFQLTRNEVVALFQSFGRYASSIFELMTMLQRGAAALLCLALSVAFVEAQFTLGRSCFCKGPEGEAVDECPCDGEASIDDFNNRRVFPILQRLLQKDFFRFYKVNMAKTCPFWPDERQCGLNKCGIDDCDHEVPPALKVSRVVSMGGSPSSTSLAEAKDADDKPGCKQTISNQFDPLDASLSDDNQAQLQHMDMHKFCDYEDSSDARYYDMAKNPERYTGYSGNSAWKVWKAIYEENCFKPENNSDLCLEKKVFQRLMSGMHSAISISISSHNYKPAPAGFGSGTWFRNNKMFEKAFGTSVSAEGPERLKNVYFVYLLELRALMKAAPYLQQELFFTGNEEEDRETRKLVENLMEVVNSYRHQFDETEMFTGVESHARELREEFRQHFVNISRIMDCVECDKCRLWGKLQTHGMGTALKILFSDLPSSLFKSSEGLKCEFTRNELVALFQSFGRYASSIREVEEFRKEATGDTYRRIEL